MDRGTVVVSRHRGQGALTAALQSAKKRANSFIVQARYGIVVLEYAEEPFPQYYSRSHGDWRAVGSHVVNFY